MTLIACGQNEIMPAECPSCGGWLHRERPGGYPTAGMTVCSEDCAADQHERRARVDVSQHLSIRDLLCECDICAAHGHPTADERNEYQRWRTEETASGRPAAGARVDPP